MCCTTAAIILAMRSMAYKNNSDERSEEDERFAKQMLAKQALQRTTIQISAGGRQLGAEGD